MEIKMPVIRDSSLVIILVMSIAGPVQAQGPTGGDYYAPGPTVVVHPTQGQLKLNEQGDYYVGDKMILNKRRAEALKRALITPHLNRTVTWRAWRVRARLPRRSLQVHLTGHIDCECGRTLISAEPMLAAHDAFDRRSAEWSPAIWSCTSARPNC